MTKSQILKEINKAIEILNNNTGGYNKANTDAFLLLSMLETKIITGPIEEDNEQPLKQSTPQKR